MEANVFTATREGSMHIDLRGYYLHGDDAEGTVWNRLEANR